MGAGRPPDRWKHVDRLEGDEALKRRLRLVLETLSGERSVEGACAALGVSPSRFHEIRQEALQGALAGLSPGPSGRPVKQDPTAEAERLRELEKENQELKIELQASYVRTEIALAMPHLLTPKARAEIKKKRAWRRWFGSSGAGDGT